MAIFWEAVLYRGSETLIPAKLITIMTIRNFSLQFVKFLMAGGLAATMNFGSRILFSHFVAYEFAVLLAFLVGLLSGFILMKKFVFSSNTNTSLTLQVYKYIGINLFALLQTLIISIILVRWLLPMLNIHTYAESLAHLVGISVPIITSYFGHKILTFK